MSGEVNILSVGTVSYTHLIIKVGMVSKKWVSLQLLPSAASGAHGVYKRGSTAMNRKGESPLLNGIWDAVLLSQTGGSCL